MDQLKEISKKVYEDTQSYKKWWDSTQNLV